MNKRKRLVIISHTEHYLDQGRVYGWGPTVNEINELAPHWEEVVHVACLYDQPKPSSAMPYVHQNIRFVPIPPFGGPSLSGKWSILSTAPVIIWRALRHAASASEVQLRLPTAFGVYLLPLFSLWFFRRFTLWVKYAGTWSSNGVPVFYRFQQWWLKQNFTRTRVTINGQWPGQPEHCLSFANPCLKEDDLKAGREVCLQKQFNKPFTFVFVARLEKAKGTDDLIQAIGQLPVDLIKQLHIVGEGEERERLQAAFAPLGSRVVFHGFRPKQYIYPLFAESHFNLLPSKSEGFPKTIAEGACFGCIPVVSDVGSIPHYIHPENGFLWQRSGTLPFADVLLTAVGSPATELKKRSNAIADLATDFTHEAYYQHLTESIFDPVSA